MPWIAWISAPSATSLDKTTRWPSFFAVTAFVSEREAGFWIK
tara:strand:- start:2433 stop:2558 length:126 start_codon:yes stop_codon:yes gene_type:complete